MIWEKEVQEIARRRELAARMGGAESVARHHQAGKLTVRERLDQLLDPSSFQEIGVLTGAAKYDRDGHLTDLTPANIVIGTGRINQRRVVVSGEDFTIRGGSSEATNSDKWIWAERLAFETRTPLVRLVDTAGGSVRLLEQAGATKMPGYAGYNPSDMLATIPVAAAALGAVAGLGAFRVVFSHFSVMVKGTSQIFAAGPPVVEPATGEKVTKEELGGAQVHARGSGVVDNEAVDEADALAQIRRFLSYLPQNAFEVPPRSASTDDPGRREEELLSIIPRNRRRPYDVRRLLHLIFDLDSLFEIGRYQGRSQVTMLGRLRGRPVGIMANDTNFFGGGMDSGAAEKIIRFVDLCDAFHLPVVNFVDQPGVVVGLAAERQGALRKAVRALLAIEQSRMPWIAIILRRAFGLAGSAYGRPHDLNPRYAWPSAYWGSIPLEGGIEAAYRREIETAPDPAARLEELQAHYQTLVSPFRTAERFGVHDIIDPRDTRPLLGDWVEQAYDMIPRQLGPVLRTMRP
ncbi:MAG: carboxyl transferase domain-containing protein [Thermodesulfobacteriota bacterium]